MLGVQAGDAAGNWSAATDVTVSITNVNKRPAWCLPTPQGRSRSGQRDGGQLVTDANSSDPDSGDSLRPLHARQCGGHQRVLRNRPGTGGSPSTAAGAARSPTPAAAANGGRDRQRRCRAETQGTVSIGNGDTTTAPKKRDGWASYDYAENQTAGSASGQRGGHRQRGRERLALAGGTQTSDDRHYQIGGNGHITLAAAGAGAGVSTTTSKAAPNSVVLSAQLATRRNWSAATDMTVNVTNVNEAPSLVFANLQGRSKRAARQADQRSPTPTATTRTAATA